MCVRRSDNGGYSLSTYIDRHPHYMYMPISAMVGEEEGEMMWKNVPTCRALHLFG